MRTRICTTLVCLAALLCLLGGNGYAQNRATPSKAAPKGNGAPQADITKAEYFRAQNVTLTGPDAATFVTSLGTVKLQTNIPIGNPPSWEIGYVLGDGTDTVGVGSSQVFLLNNDPSGFYVFLFYWNFVDSQSGKAVVRWSYGGTKRVWCGPVQF
jgi:hypothetical protein